MDVLYEDENLIYLYQLIEGKADGSYAHHVATLAGIPSKLISRGIEITDLLKKHNKIIPIKNIDSKEKLKQYLTICQEFLTLDLENENIDNFLQFVLKKTILSDCSPFSPLQVVP